MQCQRISLVVQKANTLPAQGGSRFSGGGGGGGERRMIDGSHTLRGNFCHRTAYTSYPVS